MLGTRDGASFHLRFAGDGHCWPAISLEHREYTAFACKPSLWLHPRTSHADHRSQIANKECHLCTAYTQLYSERGHLPPPHRLQDLRTPKSAPLHNSMSPTHPHILQTRHRPTLEVHDEHLRDTRREGPRRSHNESLPPGLHRRLPTADP